MSENSKQRIIKLDNQQVVDAFAQYLYDIGELGDGEATGSLVYELDEKEGVKIVLTVNNESDIE